ncbi:MAG: fumarylacetoacetate hydrolase family protein [Halopseudomonas sp.]|uniref:2-keto-4-pentenoate hydratase n=1 Tax=Halopseudomonas sp. TaxID=2901191 RepID=UPI003003127F
MSQKEANPRRAAELLLAARAQRQPCDAVAADCGISNLPQAYAAQQQWQALSLQQGDRVIGYKLGVSNPAVQAKLGLSGPLEGVLMASGLREAGQQLNSRDFIAPRAEIEVAMIFAHELHDPQLDRAQLVAALQNVVPALEICDSAIAGWPSSLFDAVADNLSSGAFLLGTQRNDPSNLDVSQLAATLEINGKPVAEGNTGSCMGDPLNACLWLVRERLRQGGTVKAGDIILTGALTGLHPVAPGDRLVLRMGGLGEVSCSFSA